MRGSQRVIPLWLAVITVLSACVAAVGGDQAAPDSRSQKVAAYQNMRSCLSELGQANQAGATDADRVQIMRGCAARSGKTFDPTDLQKGIELEQQGRYAEAAAAYQAHLNASGHPDGDGYVAGERLAYLYANGHGVPKDTAKARSLLSVGSSDRNRIDLSLLDHNLLPDRPEGVPAVLAKEKAIEDEEQRKALEQRQRVAAEELRERQAWRAAHPQEAHAQDVQSCRSGCESNLNYCESQQTMDFSGFFNGSYSTPNYHCGEKAQACLSRCPN